MKFAAEQFVQPRKGLLVQSKRVVIFSIYDWYAEGFGGVEALELHINKHLGMLNKVSIMPGEKIEYRYDWGLNDGS